MVQANVMSIQVWLEMSDACEAVITNQTTSPFENLAAAEPLIRVDGLKEMAVRHPSQPLIASAVSDGSNWFLCIVSANPPVEARNAGQLIGAWSLTQFNLVKQAEFTGVVFDDGQTFQPVRVRCGRNGQMTVVLAFSNDSGEFRIGVVNRLPASVSNPCPS